MATTTTATGHAAPTQRVVVGIDGSEGSNRAPEWAAAEAGRTGAVLEVHASYGPGYVFITAEKVHQSLQQLIDEAADHIATVAPGSRSRG
jgi:nucleotide-binding universal stress UspA family protein